VQPVDGTRERPPGKTAENWSRRDGIRAGAVSGPWRSAPRDPQTTREAETPAVGLVAERPEALVVAPEPRRRFGSWAWVALGVLALAGMAVLFRPGGDEVSVAGLAPAPAAPTSGDVLPDVAPAAQAPRIRLDPALASVSIVRLRIGPDLPPERQSAILAALKEAGLDTVLVEPLPFEIATSRVGYYRADDLPAAEALGRVVAPVIAPGGSVGVRDYGALLADAQPGRLDLWIGS
jgi:hypothetical protein